MRTWLTVWMGVLGGASSLPAATVLVEAEQFENLGGWVIDSQFMDQMGSPFLLAHGLGVPVEDAQTTVKLPAAGKYRVWVRTRDWVATWKAPGAPGKFQLLIDGQPLPTVFGTSGAQWHWQDGGQVEVARDAIELTLHDLTGFEGRCESIVFCGDTEPAPPAEEPELSRFRRQSLGLPAEPLDAGQYDLVVVGGGIAGTCASISAARLGLKVAFVQDRPVVGGNNSSEVRVWLQGARNRNPYPRVGDVVRELEQERTAHYGPANTADLYEDEKKLGVLQAEPNLSLFLLHRAQGVEMDGPRIRSVIAQHTVSGQRYRFAGRWFADTTGDGCVGGLAGADHELTRTGHMGACNLWNAIETPAPVPFPRCPWALDLSDKPFPGRGLAGDKRGLEALGGWYWESGFDRHPIDEQEYIRDWNFRAMYGAWDALKNVDGVYPNHRLNWSAYVAGKRESRRLLGDVVLSKEDVLSGKVYPDGCVPTGWKIDLHLPDPRYEKGFEGDAFIAQAHFTSYTAPYWIPYRCLYSRNVPNLFMAGRDISVTHEALGTVRVMRTGGCMGEIVGMAASLCQQHTTDPRGVWEKHLEDLLALMRRGVGKTPPAPAALNPPAWLEKAGPNLARTATVTVSGNLKADSNPPELLNDGRLDVADNDGRWLSEARAPSWAEFSWTEPQTLSAARIVSGYSHDGDTVSDPIQAFVIEYLDGQDWREIPATRTSDNVAVEWQAQFPPVTATRLRLQITQTKIDVARIWEIELYNVPAEKPD